MSMIKDPCKKERCISYPICISKKTIWCDTLSKVITAYIEKDIINPYYKENKKRIKISIIQANIIHNHLTPIFPNLEIIPYITFGHTTGIIHLKRKLYTFINHQGSTYKSASYDYSRKEGLDIIKEKTYSIHDPLAMYRE